MINRKYKTNKKSESNTGITLIDRLYACRDLEISNLWQRSAFLAVFLLLIFTGYGTLLTKALEEFKYLDSDNINAFGLYNIILLVISIIGCIFSLLWIFMAKGSKAWYEIYAEAISDYERCYPTIGSKIFGMGKNHHPSYQSDNNIFSTSGGAYSVSKVNIMIGQISFSIWLFTSIIHILIVSISTFFFDDFMIASENQYSPFIIIIIIITIIFIIIFKVERVERVFHFLNKILKLKKIRTEILPISSSLNFNEYKPFFDVENKYDEKEKADLCQFLAKIVNKEIQTDEEKKLMKKIVQNYDKLSPMEQKRYEYVKEHIEKLLKK